MIILASASPRRRELLTQIGCNFRIVTAEVEEEKTNDLPEELVVNNAILKAKAVAAENDAPVLGADTAVVLDGRIYGKPENREEAAEMLHSLSGRKHQVMTGIAFVYQGKVWQAVEKTAVYMAKISTDEIAKYVATGEADDKAGAYAVQGRAAAFIERLEGSFTNVVGLPLHRVVELAKKAGIDLYDDHGAGFTS